MDDEDEPRGLRGYLAGLNDGPGGSSMNDGPEHFNVDVGSRPGPEPHRDHLADAQAEMESERSELRRERGREQRDVRHDSRPKGWT